MNRFSYIIAAMALVVMVALGAAYYLLAVDDSRPTAPGQNPSGEFDTSAITRKAADNTPANQQDSPPVLPADDKTSTGPILPDEQPQASVDQPPVERPPVTYKEEEFVLSGTVHRDNGEPIVANIQMSHRNRSSSSGQIVASIVAVSDVNGAFTAAVKLPFPSDGTGVEIALKALAGSVASEQKTVTAYPFTTIGVDLVLPQAASLSGTLVDAVGNPVVGAEVMVRLEKERAGPRCLSDAEGAFACSDLAAGDYVVVISARGYKSPYPPQRVAVNSGDAIRLEPLVLGMLTSIRFRLLSPEGVLPAKGTAEIYDVDGKVTRLEVIADRDGYVLLSPVPDNAIEFELQVKLGERSYSTTARVVVSVVPGVHRDVGDVTVETQP